MRIYIPHTHTSNQPPSHRRLGLRILCTRMHACVLGVFYCKNKMDTNPFVAAACLSNSNLTLLAVETRKNL